MLYNLYNFSGPSMATGERERHGQIYVDKQGKGQKGGLRMGNGIGIHICKDKIWTFIYSRNICQVTLGTEC